MKLISKPIATGGNRAGFSTFELLFSVTVSSVVVAGLISVLLNLSRFSIDTELRAEADYGLVRLKEEIGQIVEELNSHRLGIFPRVHNPGLISFADGSPNPVMNTNPSGQSYPSPNSDAITSLVIRPLESYRVTDARVFGSHYLFFACPRWKNISAPAKVRSFLAVSSDNSFELTGDSEAAGGSGCRNFTLSRQKSMSLENTGSPLVARILIPIDRHYTLYVGIDGQLRYLGHAGSQNIENQPLFEGMEKLRLSAAKSPSVIKLVARISNGKETRLTYSPLFSRENSYNFMFNFNAK